MVYQIEDFFEKFKYLDRDFQLLPGADGHVIFIPGQTPAFQNISN